MNKISRENLPFCPKCGQRTLSFYGGKRWQCGNCNFTLYQNVAAAVALILAYGEKIVLIERNKEPQKGLLALPGGFADPQERAEDAVKRECAEEIGIQIENPVFFCTFPNIYRYKDILYNTCDLFFTAQIDTALFKTEADLLDALKRQENEIAQLLIIKKNSIPLEKIAFPSVRQALELYIGGKKNKND